MERLFFICLAGAFGTGARYLIGYWVTDRFGTGFPYATLWVNLAGCFLMGLLMTLVTSTPALSPTARLALTVGFLGGFTTYSSFNYETTELLRNGAPWSALLNVSLTLLGCFTAGLAGSTLAERIVRN